jgi:hypothetical protein
MAFFPKDDPASVDRLRTMMGPGQVDQQIRQAIQFAWMMLPDEKKTVTELERVIRQFIERALKDFREDAETFGQASRRPESASGDP